MGHEDRTMTKRPKKWQTAAKTGQEPKTKTAGDKRQETKTETEIRQR